MRVLYHHRIRSKDGQFVHLEELVRALRAQGQDVIVVGPGHVQTAHMGSGAGMVAWLKRWMPRALYELLELGYSVRDYLCLVSAIRRYRPDFIYERYNLYFLSGVWASKRYGIPLLLEVNAPLFEERSRFGGGIALGRLARWSELTVWRGADRVLPVTEVLAEKIATAGVPRNRIRVVHNAINEDHFSGLPERDAAKARAGLEGRLVLGFVGFMRDWHGLDRVLRYMAGNRDIRIHSLFVGDGPDRPRLESLAQTLGLSDRLTITGIVERSEIPSYIAAFDIALQPAVVEYASPLKLFEYLAVGLPIIAPDSANIREILAHEKNALLFRSGDDSSFIEAVDRVCRHACLRKELGHAARQTIQDKNLTWSANARRVIEISVALCAGSDP